MAPALIEEIHDDSVSFATIELSPVESTLRQILLDAASYIDENPTDSQSNLSAELKRQPLVLRFTGGWVRDKLLGVDSHDIDVAINKMTGYQFSLRLKEYLELPGNLAKYGLEGVAADDKQDQKAGNTSKSKIVGGLHKIEANPEKSKHLETVTTKILGLDIDLVNLRKETYSDDSRNPQMEFGTPEEDALRRDATANAMFYNINTETIEDFTGRGHQDMAAKILRTPLEPHQTFKDDPLRVLRLIRFASRLNYTIHPDALAAMRSPDIKDALRRKISRERVGIELEKALRGPDPHEAMRLLFALDLYETVFCDPTVPFERHYRPDTSGWQILINHLQDTLDSGNALTGLLMNEREDRFFAWMMAAMVPYRDAPRPEALQSGRKAPPPIPVTVAREGIKAPNRMSDLLLAAIQNQEDISGLVDKLSERLRRPVKAVVGTDAAARDVLGMAIRRWGPTWRTQVVWAWLSEIADGTGSIEATDRKFTTFVKHLQSLSILDACTFKPLLDGKALSKALSLAPGIWMKDALDVVMAYQLRHPEHASPEDAIAEVQQAQKNKQTGGELTSSLVRHFLQLTIRPSFSKAKPSSVTDSGRQNTRTVLPEKLTMHTTNEIDKKPWKSTGATYILDVLKWCVNVLNEELVEDVWPLIVPPLLTLVDDWEVAYKRLGTELLNKLLLVTPPHVLIKTGLGQVFEDALMPGLTYLPTITPEEESVLLLDQVYPALLTLARVRFSSGTGTATKHSPEQLNHQRVKFIDTIIRKGIIYGYTHCNQYPLVVATLFKHLITNLDELGIESVKHLKFILPMLTEALSHPLIVPGTTWTEASVNVLQAATKAMQAVIRNAWPRMVVYRAEVLKGVISCWIKLQSHSDPSAVELRVDMQETVAMLRAAVGEQIGFEEECQTLVETDGRVRGLFDWSNTGQRV